MQRYFKTGEFAKLCRVNKDTVLYYDKIGLLKPDFVNEKGYRYYSNKRIIDLYVIKTMQGNGIPLDEIANYINSGKTEDAFSGVIQKTLLKLREQRRKLDFSIHSMEVALNGYEYYKSRDIEKVYVEARNAEYYIAGNFLDKSYSYNYVDVDEIEMYNEHLNYLNECGIDFVCLEGYCYSLDIFENDHPADTKILSCIFESIECDRLLVKPSGNYIVLLEKGMSFESRKKALLKIKKYAEENNYKLKGYVYHFEIMSYMEFENEDEYVVMYEVMVE